MNVQMSRFCDAGNGCSLHFPASLIKILLVTTASASCYLKVSLPIFLIDKFLIKNMSTQKREVLMKLEPRINLTVFNEFEAYYP